MAPNLLRSCFCLMSAGAFIAGCTIVLIPVAQITIGSYQVYSLYPPNYDKNTTDPNKTNNSIHTPAVPDNKLSLTPQNQNQSLPDANHTSNNQTLRKAILALAASNISTKINGEHLNAPQAALYCDRTLYLFAFWTTTLLCVLAGNTVVIILCLYGFMYVGNRIQLTT
ncbi:uncharacterized protein LOC113145447 isoform X2 [Mastacembelus armatus]|uniref:uncharacterized protein LOC113145447 isoform X2 n=1 Tax=Mastacembelus armatus TaxID=205130 RepID=UPI000E454221|nr:uncharacterized protein LOC113145447 isoform X2 [Mastacembelus armatus]